MTCSGRLGERWERSRGSGMGQKKQTMDADGWKTARQWRGVGSRWQRCRGRRLQARAFQIGLQLVVGAVRQS